MIFTCLHPACRFSGDAAALVALARKIPASDAIDLFLPGNELADCMAEPLSAEDAALYADRVHSQATLKTWLSAAKARMRENPERSGIRTGMSLNNLKLLHPDIGMFEPGAGVDGLPRCLSEFSKPRYKKSCLILYPYTHNGEVTKIDVLDAANKAFRHTVVVTRPDIGVFGESCATLSGKVLAVERPEDAAKLYAAYAMSSTKAPPVVAFNAYPLPETMLSVTSVALVSADECRPSARFLLKTMSSQDICSWTTPDIKVMWYPHRVDRLTYQDLVGWNPKTMKSVGVPQLLARQMAEMVDDGESKQLLDMLLAEQAPMTVRNVLKSLAKGLGTKPGAKLANMLALAGAEGPCDLRLANGKAVHCGPDGVYAVRVSGDREPLCNVGVSVNARLVSTAGGDPIEAFDCTFSARGGFPAVRVKVAWKDLTAGRLRAAVQRAYSALGLSPYVAFYPSPGFAWQDVMSKLAENCKVEKERRPPSEKKMKKLPINFKELVTGDSVDVGPIEQGKKED